MSEDKANCFKWIRGLRKTTNEMCGRFLTALRRKGRKVDPVQHFNNNHTPDVAKSNTSLGRNQSVAVQFQNPLLFEDNVKRCPAHLFTASSATAIVRNEEDELKKFVQCYVSGILKNSIEIVKSERPQSVGDVSASSSVISNLAGELVNASLTKIAKERMV